jgi:hypothetical protein
LKSLEKRFCKFFGGRTKFKIPSEIKPPFKEFEQMEKTITSKPSDAFIVRDEKENNEKKRQSTFTPLSGKFLSDGHLEMRIFFLFI